MQIWLITLSSFSLLRYFFFFLLVYNMIELDDPASYRESGRNAIISAPIGQMLHGTTSVASGTSLIVHC